MLISSIPHSVVLATAMMESEREEVPVTGSPVPFRFSITYDEFVREAGSVYPQVTEAWGLNAQLAHDAAQRRLNGTTGFHGITGVDPRPTHIRVGTDSIPLASLSESEHAGYLAILARQSWSTSAEVVRLRANPDEIGDALAAALANEKSGRAA